MLLPMPLIPTLDPNLGVGVLLLVGCGMQVFPTEDRVRRTNANRESRSPLDLPAFANDCPPVGPAPSR